jgi:hypothetical protein
VWAVTKPLLLVDIDGVISVWGASHTQLVGVFAQVDGIPHVLSQAAADHLRGLEAHFELVWCSGWEDRANDHLPHLVGLGPFPHLTLGRTGTGHWKLGAIDGHAGPDRPLAWVDDDLDERCETWAAARRGPTLLVRTHPASGLTSADATRLAAWAQALGGQADDGA